MQLIHNSKAAVHKAAAVTARLVKIAARKRPLLWPVWQTLPVAGLDVPAAQSVLYTLRRGLPEEEVSQYSTFEPITALYWTVQT